MAEVLEGAASIRVEGGSPTSPSLEMGQCTELPAASYITILVAVVFRTVSRCRRHG
jgi:hypothetical protein